VLADGAYEALCVDAVEDGEAIVLSITIVAGEHKGEVVDVRATGLRADPLDLLGTPCTLTVADGEPAVDLA
jgi:hypothetical protein